MYGDGQLFNSKNVENLSKIIRASQIAVGEIWKVYQTGDDNPSSLFAPLEWVYIWPNIIPNFFCCGILTKSIGS